MRSDERANPQGELGFGIIVVRYNTFVRKLALLLMLLILPFQFVWGAGASVCAHEKSPLSTHFGHHSSQSVSATGDANVDEGNQSFSDCSVCHLVSLKPPGSHTNNVILPNGCCATPHPPPSIASPPPDAPERPKWSLTA